MNLPKGGQANSTVNQTLPQSTGRVVRVERLNKLSDGQLQRQIDRLPNKLKRKAEILESKIGKLRARHRDIENYYQRTEAACREILAARKKSTSTPNASAQAKAA